MKHLEEYLPKWLNNNNTLNWGSIIIGHFVFIPSLLALLTALTDNTPSVDIVILVQLLLILSFIRAIVGKDTVALVFHSMGWFVNAGIMFLILFK